MTTIRRPDGTRIHGPGKLTSTQLQHRLALRARAGAVPSKRRHDGKGSRSQQRHAAAVDH